MKRSLAIAVVVVSVAVSLFVVFSSPAQAQRGRGGKLDVRYVEAGMNASDGSITARFHTVSGTAYVKNFKRDEAAENLLQMVTAVSLGRGRMAIELEDGEVTTVYVEAGAR